MTVRITEEDPRFHEPFVSPEPTSSPYPVALYEEEQDPETTEWEEEHLEIETKDIASIISDVEVITSVLFDQQQDPLTMLAAIKTHIQWIHHHIKVNLLQLGYYLFWVERLRLYLHEDQSDMKSWMEYNELNPDIRIHAQDIYKTWIGMRDLGYPITRLTTGDITVSKMREIRHEMRDYKRQQKTLTEKPAAVENVEEERSEEQEEEQFLHIVQAEPPQGEESLVDIKAKIETIAALRENEVISDQRARDGIPDRTALFLRNIKVSSTGLATATVTFKCDEESVKAMFRGYTEFVFNFERVDGTLSSQKIKAGELDMIIEQLGGVIDTETARHHYEDEGYDL